LIRESTVRDIMKMIRQVSKSREKMTERGENDVSPLGLRQAKKKWKKEGEESEGGIVYIYRLGCKSQRYCTCSQTPVTGPEHQHHHHG